MPAHFFPSSSNPETMNDHSFTIDNHKSWQLRPHIYTYIEIAMHVILNE